MAQSFEASARKKEETRWETCLGEHCGKADGIVRSCPAKHRLMGDAWNVELLTRNAELRISLFLKDGTSDWHILKLVWQREVGLCMGALKGGGLNGRIHHYSKSVELSYKQFLSFSPNSGFGSHTFRWQAIRSHSCSRAAPAGVL